MQLTETEKEAIRKAKADAKNPDIKGKCVLFDGGMLGKGAETSETTNEDLLNGR